METLRFLDGDELEAIKFAIGQSEGLSIEECMKPTMIGQHFLLDGTNFMLYDTDERAVHIAWVLSDVQSFIVTYIHEEVHRILHKKISLKSCCDYDNVARLVDDKTE